MKSDYTPPDMAEDPNTQDPHCLVQCTAHPDVLWVQHHCGIYRSTDDGAATFKTFSTGLPQQHAYDLIYRHGLAVAPNGKNLAMASTTGSLWLSGDAGESWNTVSQNLPPVAVVKFV